MGDVVIYRQSDAWQRLIASAAVLALLAGIGCTSSKPARVVEATPAAAAETSAGESPHPGCIESPCGRPRQGRWATGPPLLREALPWAVSIGRSPGLARGLGQAYGCQAASRW